MAGRDRSRLIKYGVAGNPTLKLFPTMLSKMKPTILRSPAEIVMERYVSVGHLGGAKDVGPPDSSRRHASLSVEPPGRCVRTACLYEALSGRSGFVTVA